MAIALHSSSEFDSGTGNNGSATTVAATVPSGGYAAGVTLLVAVAANTATSPTGVADSRSNTYTSRAVQTISGRFIQVYTTRVTTALQTGDTITATWAAGQTRRLMKVVALNNVLTASDGYDVSGVDKATPSTTRQGGTATSTVAGASFGFIEETTGTQNPFPTFTPGTGYTALTDAHSATVGTTGTTGILTEYKLNTTAGSQQAGGSSTLSADWGGITICLKDGTLDPILPNFLDPSTLYAPTLSCAATIGPPTAIIDSSALYAPTLSCAATIGPPTALLDSSAVYAPTLGAAIEVTGSGSVFINDSALYAPTLVPGGVTLGPPSALINTSTLYAPTLSPGAVTLGPPDLLNDSVLYGPRISTEIQHIQSTASGSATGASTCSASLTGVSIGNLLISTVLLNETSGAITGFTPPAGWTQSGSEQRVTNRHVMMVFYLTATDTAPTVTYSWTGGSRAWAVTISEYRSANAGSYEFGTHAQGSSAGAVNTVTGTSASATALDNVLEIVVFGHNGNATNTYSGGWNERAHAESTSGSGASNVSLAYTSRPDQAAGSFNNVATWTGTARDASWFTLSFLQGTDNLIVPTRIDDSTLYDATLGTKLTLTALLNPSTLYNPTVVLGSSQTITVGSMIDSSTVYAPVVHPAYTAPVAPTAPGAAGYSPPTVGSVISGVTVVAAATVGSLQTLLENSTSKQIIVLTGTNYVSTRGAGGSILASDYQHVVWAQTLGTTIDHAFHDRGIEFHGCKFKPSTVTRGVFSTSVCITSDQQVTGTYPFKFYDCEFDGTNGLVSYGLLMYNAQGLYFERCVLHDFKLHNCYAYRSNSSSATYTLDTIKDVSSYGCYDRSNPGVWDGAAEHGFTLGWPVTNKVERLWCSGNAWAGIVTLGQCYDTTFESCKFSDHLPGSSNFGTGAYLEHLSKRLLFRWCDFGPGVTTAVNHEWDHGTGASNYAQNSQDNHFHGCLLDTKVPGFTWRIGSFMDQGTLDAFFGSCVFQYYNYAALVDKTGTPETYAGGRYRQVNCTFRPETNIRATGGATVTTEHTSTYPSKWGTSFPDLLDSSTVYTPALARSITPSALLNDSALYNARLGGAGLIAPSFLNDSTMYSPTLSKAAGNTYYVTPDAGANGTGTQLDPYRSGQVNGLNLVAGDTVLFKTTDSLSQQAIYNFTLTPGFSGTAGSSITYGTWGTGQAIIRAPSSLASAVVNASKQYLTWSNLVFESLPGSTVPAVNVSTSNQTWIDCEVNGWGDITRSDTYTTLATCGTTSCTWTGGGFYNSFGQVLFGTGAIVRDAEFVNISNARIFGSAAAPCEVSNCRFDTWTSYALLAQGPGEIFDNAFLDGVNGIFAQASGSSGQLKIYRNRSWWLTGIALDVGAPSVNNHLIVSASNTWEVGSAFFTPGPPNEAVANDKATIDAESRTDGILYNASNWYDTYLADNGYGNNQPRPRFTYVGNLFIGATNTSNPGYTTATPASQFFHVAANNGGAGGGALPASCFGKDPDGTFYLRDIEIIGSIDAGNKSVIVPCRLERVWARNLNPNYESLSFTILNEDFVNVPFNATLASNYTRATPAGVTGSGLLNLTAALPGLVKDGADQNWNDGKTSSTGGGDFGPGGTTLGINEPAGGGKFTTRSAGMSFSSSWKQANPIFQGDNHSGDIDLNDLQVQAHNLRSSGAGKGAHSAIGAASTNNSKVRWSRAYYYMWDATRCGSDATNMEWYRMSVAAHPNFKFAKLEDTPPRPSLHSDSLQFYRVIQNSTPIRPFVKRSIYMRGMSQGLYFGNNNAGSSTDVQVRELILHINNSALKTGLEPIRPRIENSFVASQYCTKALYNPNNTTLVVNNLWQGEAGHPLCTDVTNYPNNAVAAVLEGTGVRVAATAQFEMKNTLIRGAATFVEASTPSGTGSLTLGYNHYAKVPAWYPASTEGNWKYNGVTQTTLASPFATNSGFAIDLVAWQPTFAAGTGSPVIDAGTTTVTGLTYALNASGDIEYRGSPDIGYAEKNLVASLEILPNYLGDQATVYSASMGNSLIQTSLLDSSAVYAPTLGNSVIQTALLDTSALYAPTLTTGTATILPGFINDSAIYNAGLARADQIAPDFLSTSTVYAPTLSPGGLSIVPGFINDWSLYAASLSTAIEPAFADLSETYEPTLTNVLPEDPRPPAWKIYSTGQIAPTITSTGYLDAGN